MKLKSLVLPIVAAVSMSAVQAFAQAGCQTIDASQGTAEISFTPAGLTTPTTTCKFEPGAAGGMAIACVHGFQVTQANLLLLSKVATRSVLTAAEKSTLTGMTSVRGGFVMNSVGLPAGSARTTIITTRTAFNAFINSTNYSAPDSMPSRLTSLIDLNNNSVSSTEIVNTNGSMAGFHASGNISVIPETRFHLIMDTNNIDDAYLLRVGSNMSSWLVCQGQSPQQGDPVSITSFVHSIVKQYQTGGAASHKVMLK